MFGEADRKVFFLEKEFTLHGRSHGYLGGWTVNVLMAETSMAWNHEPEVLPTRPFPARTRHS